jgi:hypothetical protein
MVMVLREFIPTVLLPIQIQFLRLSVDAGCFMIGVTMEYTYKYNADLHIIEVKYLGKITSKDVGGILSGALQAAEENGCVRFLSDCREAELSLSVMDIYRVPKAFADLSASRGLLIRTFRYGILISKGSKNFGFLETVFINNMQSAKLFFVLEPAKEWLIAQ